MDQLVHREGSATEEAINLQENTITSETISYLGADQRNWLDLHNAVPILVHLSVGLQVVCQEI